MALFLLRLPFSILLVLTAFRANLANSKLSHGYLWKIILWMLHPSLQILTMHLLKVVLASKMTLFACLEYLAVFLIVSEAYLLFFNVHPENVIRDIYLPKRMFLHPCGNLLLDFEYRYLVEKAQNYSAPSCDSFSAEY